MSTDYTKSLLKIKTFIPKLRSDLVSRSRLIDKLNLASEKKLIIVKAPAGYGKSTLVADWIKQSKKNGAWVQHCENDNDLGRFLSYIVLSLKQSNKNLSDSILPLIHSPQPPSLQILINNLLNDLSYINEETTLVLDDFHLITNEEVHKSFSYLIQNLPEKLQILVISRAEVPVALSTFRARNQILEIDIEDLKFKIPEMKNFVEKVIKIKLTENQIFDLDKKIDGWISALQLAALSIKNNENIEDYINRLTGTDRLIESYFLDEVFEKQEKNIQEFLSKTSILKKFNSELCNYLLEIENSNEVIEGLENTNAFIIPMDNKREWYRYHHLFAELLRNKLKKEGKFDINVLYKRASEWHENAEDMISAIDYSLEIKDFTKASDMILKLIPDYISFGGRDIFVNWLHQFPLDILRKNKNLWIYYILSLLDQGIFKFTKEKLDELWGKEEYFNGFSEDYRKIIEGYKLGVLSSITNHTELDSQKAKNLTKQALKVLPKSEALGISIAHGHLGVAKSQLEEYEKAKSSLIKAQGGASIVNYALLYLLWWSYISQIELEVGELTKAKAMIHKIMKYADGYGVIKSNVFSNAIIGLGRIYFERNDFENAKIYLEQGIELAESKEYMDRLILGYFAYIPYLIAIKDFNSANKKIKSLRKLSDEFDNPENVENAINSLDAKIALAKKNDIKVRKYKSLFTATKVKYSSYSIQNKYVLGQIFLQLQEFESAINLLEEEIPKEENNGRNYIVIKLLISLTQAQYQNGNLKSAITTLKKAINLAETEKYIRSFLDGGSIIKELIQNIMDSDKELEKENSIQFEYLAQLLDEFEWENKRVEQIQILVEEKLPANILTSRELEVVQNLSLGLSYSEISAKMFISENTLKSHIKHIYSKLETNNRTSAVLKAKELNLI